MTETTYDTTLFDAIIDVHNRQEEGVDCPCCGRLVKVYKRTINAAMAQALVQFYKVGGTKEYVHGPSLLQSKAADEGKLRYWGLIEERRSAGSHSAGHWRVTKLGERFLKGKARVPRYARVLNRECLGLTGEKITIHDILGDTFHLSE